MQSTKSATSVSCPSLAKAKHPSMKLSGFVISKLLLCDWQDFPPRCRSRSCQSGWLCHPPAAEQREKERVSVKIQAIFEEEGRCKRKGSMFCITLCVEVAYFTQNVALAIWENMKAHVVRLKKSQQDDTFKHFFYEKHIIHSCIFTKKNRWLGSMWFSHERWKHSKEKLSPTAKHRRAF